MGVTIPFLPKHEGSDGDGADERRFTVTIDERGNGLRADCARRGGGSNETDLVEAIDVLLSFIAVMILLLLLMLLVWWVADVGRWHDERGGHDATRWGRNGTSSELGGLFVPLLLVAAVTGPPAAGVAITGVSLGAAAVGKWYV